MTERDDLPEPILQAKASLAQQRRHIGAMMGGVALGMLGILAGAAANAPDFVVLGSVGAMMLWALGNAAWMSRHADQWKRAADLLKEWDRRKLADVLGDHGKPTAAEAEAEPEDPRWQNLRTLLARIRELAEDDAHLVEVSEEVERKLKGLLRDRATLLEAIEADRALGGGSEAADARARRLQQALEARSASADRLVEAIRDLHVELAVRDASTDPLVDRLEAILAQVEAETEVAGVASSSEAAERARLARAQRASRQRE